MGRIPSSQSKMFDYLPKWSVCSPCWMNLGTDFLTALVSSREYISMIHDTSGSFGQVMYNVSASACQCCLSWWKVKGWFSFTYQFSFFYLLLSLQSWGPALLSDVKKVGQYSSANCWPYHWIRRQGMWVSFQPEDHCIFCYLQTQRCSSRLRSYILWFHINRRTCGTRLKYARLTRGFNTCFTHAPVKFWSQMSWRQALYSLLARILSGQSPNKP